MLELEWRLYFYTFTTEICQDTAAPALMTGEISNIDCKHPDRFQDRAQCQTALYLSQYQL